GPPAGGAGGGPLAGAGGCPTAGAGAGPTAGAGACPTADAGASPPPVGTGGGHPPAAAGGATSARPTASAAAVRAGRVRERRMVSCRSSLVGKRWTRPLVPHSGDSRNPSRGTAPTGHQRLPSAASHLKGPQRRQPPEGSGPPTGTDPSITRAPR